MNKIELNKAKLNGEVILPPSKSISHRAIICASLAEGETSHIKNVDLSDDIRATISCCRRLGATIVYNNIDKSLEIKGNIIKEDNKIVEFDCNESGSTLRFIIPIAMINMKKTKFIASEGLSKRPLDAYFEIFDNNKIAYKTNQGKLPLYINDTLSVDEFYIDGSISSQFITGLMMAAPLVKKDVKIILKNELESKSYVDLTMDVMKNFGIEVDISIVDNKYEFYIKKNQKYSGIEYEVEADCSQVAFWAVANYLGSEIKYNSIEKSSQGDFAIFKHLHELSDMRKKYNIDEKKIKYSIDAKNIPDIIPILSLAASLTKGVEVNIINAARLRIKECDRLSATYDIIKELGGNIYEYDDALKIIGIDELNGDAFLDSYNDHRIAMMIGIAATIANKKITLSNYESVKKSYPKFWKDYENLNGNIRYL